MSRRTSAATSPRGPAAGCAWRAAPVKLFSRDPELLGAVPAHVADDLRSRISVASIRLRAGRWEAPPRRPDGIFALLLLDGLLTRHVSLGGRSSVELLGPGDVLEPWHDECETLLTNVEWRAELPTTLAMLDRGLMRTALQHESILMTIMDRLVMRSRRVAVQSALSTLTPIEERVLAALWHLAARWGKVTPTGVKVPFALPHRLIAEMVGATRPTVSSAVGVLRRLGLAEQVADGWVLREAGPALVSRDGEPGAKADEPTAALQRWATQTRRQARVLRE